jgi:nitrogen fixation NifU-like protein
MTDAEKSRGFGFTDPMYRENILDHYRNPRNFGRISNADASFHGDNPLCGDEIDIDLKIEKGIITDARFMGRGCAISQSSASMLTEKIIGMKLKDAAKLTKEQVLEMLGIQVNPPRLKCAILSLKVLEGALYTHAKEKEISGRESPARPGRKRGGKRR